MSIANTAPERIYLCIGDTVECDTENPSFKDLSQYDDVTWCEQKQDANDIEYVRADLVTKVATPQPEVIADEHPDDEAVDQFARQMKRKLAKARERGKSGWQDNEWTPEQISSALREHVEKGDPLDVANYCMFLVARNEPITAQIE